MRYSYFLLAWIFSFITANFLHAQLVRHTYRFNNTLSASEPDCGPDLIQSKAAGFCGAGNDPGYFLTDQLPVCTTARSLYHTNLNWGLEYENPGAKISDTYTIQMYVKTTRWGTQQWVRIIDFFPNSFSDNGLYFKKYDNHRFCLQFWPQQNTIGACPFFDDTTYYLLTFTRNGTTGMIDVYVNNILFTTYADVTNLYVAKPGNPIYIFRDDPSVPCESGEANFAYLSFSNQYSSKSQVDSVYKNVCSVINSNTADFSINPAVSCSPSQEIEVNYTGNIAENAAGYSYNWNWDGGTVVSGSGRGPYKVKWNGTGTKNVQLTIKGGACQPEVSASNKLTIGSLHLSATVTDASCTANSKGLIKLKGEGSAGSYLYSINGIDFQTTDYFETLPGSYKVYVKDNNGCSTDTTVVVKAGASIQLQSIEDTAICKGQTIRLVTVTNAAVFSWQPTTGLNRPDELSPLVSPAASIDYIITATAGNCVKKDTVSIKVYSEVNQSVTITPQTCTGAWGTIIAVASGGTAPYMYSLDSSVYQKAGEFATGLGDHTIDIEDANHCHSHAVYFVPVKNDVFAKSIPDTSICKGQKITLVSNSNANVYSWQPSTGLNDPSLLSPDAQPKESTDYILKAGNGFCASYDTVRVIVQAEVKISGTVQPQLCSGPQGTISVSASGGIAPYMYSLNTATYQNASLFTVASGDYTIDVQDANHCSGHAIYTVPLQNDITVKSIADTSICSGKEIVLNSMSNATVFSWQPPDGLDNPSILSPAAKPTRNTKYIITAGIGDCISKDTVTINIHDDIKVSAIVQPQLCTGAQGTISLTASGGKEPYMYSLNSAAYQGVNQFSVTAGDYTINVEDANHCNVQALYTVPLQNDLFVQTLPDTTICRGREIILVTKSNAQDFTWSPSVWLTTFHSMQPKASPQESTDYIVTASLNGCTQKDTVHVSVIASITVITSRDTTIDINSPAQLMAYSPELVNASGVTYVWSPSTGLSDPHIANPVATINSDQVYTVIIHSAEGCSGSGKVNLTVKKGIYVYLPSGFTPNADGRNDLFRPLTAGISRLKDFSVYNRWGKRIYSTSILGKGWDGTLNGSPQNSGTFVWMFEGVDEQGKTIRKKGVVTLIR